MDIVKNLKEYVKIYSNCANNSYPKNFKDSTDSPILSSFLDNYDNKKVSQETKYSTDDGYDVKEIHYDDGSYSIEKTKKEKTPFLLIFNRTKSKETILENYDANGNLTAKMNVNETRPLGEYEASSNTQIYDENGSLKYELEINGSLTSLSSEMTSTEKSYNDERECQIISRQRQTDSCSDGSHTSYFYDESVAYNDNQGNVINELEYYD